MKNEKRNLRKFRITVLCFLCFLAMLFSGCAGTGIIGQTYETDTLEGTNRPDKRVQWDHNIPYYTVNSNAPQNRTITLDGRTGAYRYGLSYSDDWQSAYDIYEAEPPTDPETGKTLPYIYVESGSDRIIAIDYSYANSINPSEQIIENVRKYAIDEAQRIAGEYIRTDEYKMTVSDRMRFITDYSDHTVEYYIIRFVKWIGDNKTSEKLTVEFNRFGQLQGVFMQNIGRFENYTEKDFPEIDEQAYEASVRAFLAERYKGRECEFKIRDRFFALSAEQKLLLVADLDGRFADQGPDAEFRESAIGVKTVLNV